MLNVGMGFNPSTARFFENCHKREGWKFKWSSNSRRRCHFFQKSFSQVGLFSSKRWWNLLFDLFHLYVKLTGDVVPPMLEK